MYKQFQREAVSKVFTTNLCLVFLVFSRLGDVKPYKHVDNVLQSSKREVFFTCYIHTEMHCKIKLLTFFIQHMLAYFILVSTYFTSVG